MNKELEALEIIKKHIKFEFLGWLSAKDMALVVLNADDEINDDYMCLRIEDKGEYDLLKEVLR